MFELPERQGTHMQQLQMMSHLAAMNANFVENSANSSKKPPGSAMASIKSPTTQQET